MTNLKNRDKYTKKEGNEKEGEFREGFNDYAKVLS